MAIKMPRLAFLGGHGRAGSVPDTAIAEEDLPTAFDVPPSTLMPDGAQHASTTAFDPPAARPAAPLAPKRRRGLPGLRRQPFRRQIQILLAAMLVGALAAFLLLWLDSRSANDRAALSRAVGDALMHSQRVAKAAPNALSGNVESFVQLAESRERLDAAIRGFAAGRVETAEGSVDVPGGVGEQASQLATLWGPSRDAAGVILAQQALLVQLGQLRTAVNRFDAELLENAQAIAARRLLAGGSAREVSVAGELAVLTQRIAKGVNQLVAGPGVDAAPSLALQQDIEQFRTLIDALQSGSERLRVAPAADAEVRRALEAMHRIARQVEAPMGRVLSNVGSVQAARQADARIFADSERLRAALAAFQAALVDGGAQQQGRLVGALLGAVLALVAGAGLAQAYLGEGRAPAEEAESRKEEAIHLELEAKRVNDQNQAAILRLMNELQEVADGDLTVQATVSEDITGAIADSINYTVEELRSLVSRINSTAELVNEASSKAQMIASSLQAASEQQSREIRDTGESVLRMAQQINEVSARAAESVDVARHSLAASQGGQNAVHNAIAGMNGIRDQIQETAKRIKRLGESSQEIGEIVELISDITEQTNVLALNAAIQAASAGEAGRGFTIVAEEVQRLAERSAEATKQIAALIQTIQTDTQDAVAAMERSTQGVVEGARLSDEAGRALGEIGRVSTQLAELIEEFSSTTSRQAASAGGVAQSIQRILLVTEQTSEGTLQTAGSIRQLSELAQELKSSVSRFKVS